jgi:hypothetical protein
MEKLPAKDLASAARRDEALRKQRKRSDGARFTEDAIQTMSQLAEAMEKEDAMDSQKAFKEASEAYQFLHPVNRRNRLLNVLYMKIIVRAGKMQAAVSHLNYMKTNGIYPPIVTYVTLLRALSAMRLDAKQNTNLIRQGHRAFERGMKVWKEAIDFKEGRLVEMEEQRERVKSNGVVNTAMAYRKSAEREYGKTMERVSVFESLCYSYMRFLISIDDKEEAARLIVRASDLDMANKRANIDVSHFPSSISELFLMCLGKKSVGEIAPRQAYSEALRHAKRLLEERDDDESGSTSDPSEFTPSHDAKRGRKAFVRGLRGGSTLALTEADVEEVIGADHIDDGRRKSVSQWRS